jgi:hypothetical protein
MVSAREERPQIEGIDEESLAILGEINADPNEFVDGFLLDAELTLTGMTFQKGGEKRTNPRDGSEFTTRDQLVVQYRVDNVEGYDSTTEYYGLPPTYQKKDGTTARREVQASSLYGMWLGQLAALGVSSNPQLASTYQMKNVGDLIGLRVHRQQSEAEGYNGQVMKVMMPTEILGFDNEVRAKHNLPPAEVKV